jgi:hypothetical protein
LVGRSSRCTVRQSTCGSGRGIRMVIRVESLGFWTVRKWVTRVIRDANLDTVHV